jgi:two-component system, OmpR family, sensor histidine kinase CiaH
MPDGAARAHEPDSRLVHRVRLQLIAWSAGSTLVVLLVLGAVLYAAVAATLASSSEQLLRDRAALMGPTTVTGSGSAFPVTGDGAIVGGTTVVTTTNAGQPGFAVGGPYAGTLAVIVPVDGATGAGGAPTVIGSGVIGPDGSGIVGSVTVPADGSATGSFGPPDPEGFAAAQAGRTTIRETTYQGSPVRVLSVPMSAGSGGAPAPDASAPAGVIQVVGDRTAELRTLGILLMVLLVGGLLALLAASAIGYLYATRALVPIRASLQRQREFAADTSHELRTPLAVIRAGVARARQQPDARVSEISGTLDTVDGEAVRLGALVDDLLALARTDAGSADLDLADVDLAEIAADAMAPLEGMATARGTTLELDVAPAPMRGDAVRLRRLVTVLVDNAIRHGHEHGRVRVTVRPGVLTVEDDGPGIPAADRDRVFDRFWRGASAAPGGSGLGLAIGAWIAERHGGSIVAGASRLGGARFDVTLPVH